MIDAGLAVWEFWLGALKDVLAPVLAEAGSRSAAFDYVRGLCWEASRRTCWQLAELAGHVSPRRLQGLLGEYRWDYRVLLGRLRELVVARLGSPEACLVLDETAEIKRGSATVGVARQYAGVTGQVENCQVVVFMAYVTERAHALLDFMLYLPRVWADDPDRRRVVGVPEQVAFATKPALAVALLRRAVDAAVPFAWVLADEVYGRAAQLREYVESIGRGYILTIPKNFTVVLCPGSPRTTTVDQAATTVSEDWEERSCGKGCKGHRYYQWALLATASPRHWVLLRRHPERPDQISYFYVYVPEGRAATLAALVRRAGQRWPVEECFQQGKGQVGLDQHQVRTWLSFHRHTALAMLALAIFAIATADPPTPDPTEPDHTTAPDQPAPPAPAPPARPQHWRDSAPLPHHADQPPPEDPGLVAVSVPEARRLLNLATRTISTAAQAFGLHWSNWRRRHQALARWHHYQKRLQPAPA